MKNKIVKGSREYKEEWENVLDVSSQENVLDDTFFYNKSSICSQCLNKCS